MLDLGWQELMVVAFVLVLVVGPKDLPRVLKAVARTVGKVRSMAGEFQSSLMEVADQEEFRDVRKAIDDARSGRVEAFAEIEDAVAEAGRQSGIAGDLDEVREVGGQLTRAVSGDAAPAKAPARGGAAGKTARKRAPAGRNSARRAPGAEKAS